MTVDISGVNEIHIQIAAHCPSCDRAMYYIAFDFNSDIKRVWCRNDNCTELGKKWDLNMRTGMARRRSD